MDASESRQLALRRGGDRNHVFRAGEIAHCSRFPDVFYGRPDSDPAAPVSQPLFLRVWGLLYQSNKPPWGRRPTRWQTRGIGCCVFAVQVGEDLLEHDRIFDAGDDLDVAAAGLAGLEATASCSRPLPTSM